MRADRDLFIEQIQYFDRNTLLSPAISLFDELAQMRMVQLENERISTEAHIQYSELNEKYAAAYHENEELKKLLAKEAEKNTLKTKSIFGRKTEGFFSLLDAKDHPAEEPADESTVEDAGPAKECRARETAPESRHKCVKGAGGRHAKKAQSLADSLKELPQQVIYDLDVNGLNKQYGGNNWRTACWHQHEKLMKLETPYYTQVIYTPVVSVGLEHDLFTFPCMNPLIDKSVISYTIIADILYRKFVLGLPFYRQAMDYQMQNIPLARQTIINWVNTLVPKVCEEVYEFMTQQLVGYRYTQCDETYIQVNTALKGKNNSHKSCRK